MLTFVTICDQLVTDDQTGVSKRLALCEVRRPDGMPTGILRHTERHRSTTIKDELRFGDERFDLQTNVETAWCDWISARVTDNPSR